LHRDLQKVSVDDRRLLRTDEGCYR
jgi:hypothetical protein